MALWDRIRKPAEAAILANLAIESGQKSQKSQKSQPVQISTGDFGRKQPTEPVVMHWDIHAAGLATGALVLCEDCREFTLGAVPVGDGNFADGNCTLHGPVFARCPFDCREYHARKRPWS